MFNFLALAALAPLALSAPTKRSSQLSCVQYQFSPPWSTSGAVDGYVHLFANVTQFHSDSQTYTFNETRVSLNENGDLAPCGDCRTTHSWGLEVCQGPDRKGLAGLGNSPSSFFGHILYNDVTGNYRCLTASKPFNGSSFHVEDCQYDYDNAAASGQYFTTSLSDGGYPITRLATDEDNNGQTYGINPDVEQGTPLSAWDGVATGPFTFLGWKGFDY